MVIADLHLDRWHAVGRDPLAALDPDLFASLDALIVAGDLGDKPKVRWPGLLRHLAQYVDPSRIYVIPGNHDYYHHVLDGDDRLAAICAEAGVNFAQKRVIVLGHTRYLCCTLWTDFALSGSIEDGTRDAAKGMNDYRYIRLEQRKYRKIRPSDVLAVHANHRAWLDAQLAEPFDGRTIVVTHHAPLADCLSDIEPVSCAYASDLTRMIEHHRPHAWLFGHTHEAVTFRVGATQIRNVSLGYPEHIPAGTEAQHLISGIVGLV